MPFLDHFTLMAPYYDRWFQSTEPDRLRSLLDLPVTGTLLDAGGGTGRISHLLRGLATSFIVADESLGMLKQTQLKEALAPVCTRTESLPFSDGIFERIVMVDAFHHILNGRQTAAELWRVLKPGGKIVIEEPDIRKFAVKLVALAEKMALMRSHFLSGDRIARLFPHSQARARLEQDNYTVWVVIDKIELEESTG